MYDRVYKILRSDRYKGKSVIFDKKEKKEYEFQFDRIIEDEMYDKVKQKDKKILGNREGNTKGKYLLKGKVKCKCGDTMWVLGGGKSYKYYMCQRNKHINKKLQFGSFKKSEVKEKCEFNSRISVDMLEKYVWEGLFEFLENNTKIKNEYKKRFDKQMGNKNEFIGKKKYYEKELESWNDKKDSNVDLLLDNTLSKSDYKGWKENKFDVKVEEINLRLKEINDEIGRMEINESVVDDYINLMKSDLDKEKEVKGFKDKLKKINKYIDEIGVENVEKNKWNLDIKMTQPYIDKGIIEVKDKSKSYILNFSKLIQNNLIYKLKWMFVIRVKVKKYFWYNGDVEIEDVVLLK